MNKSTTLIKDAVRHWWIFLFSGALLIVMSVFVLNQPLVSYATLSIYFAIAFFVNGLVEIAFATSNHRHLHGWGWHLAGGIFDLLVGVLLVANPILAAVSLPLFAGFWLMFRSVTVIGRSFDLKSIGSTESRWLLLPGIAGLVFSFMIIYNPELGVFTIVTWTALALLSVGIFYIMLGLRLRNGHK